MHSHLSALAYLPAMLPHLHCVLQHIHPKIFRKVVCVAQVAAMSPKKDTSKPATKAAPKPIKKEPTMVDDTRKQTSNMLTQLKNKQHKDEEKKALLQYYQNLDRFSVQKKELLQLWAKDRTCRWFASWNKTVCQTEETNAQGRMGYGTRHLQHVTSQYMLFLVHVCLAHCSALQVSAGCYAGDA